MLGRHAKYHRKHLHDAAAWERETRGQDWVLRRVTRDRSGRWVYHWTGPCNTTRTAHGTENSAAFLASLRVALASFRDAFAMKVSDDAIQERRDAELGAALLEAAQERTV